jgi:hypothetical protein
MRGELINDQSLARPCLVICIEHHESPFQHFILVHRLPSLKGDLIVNFSFILFSDALAPMDAVVKLLMNVLSRKFEFEANASL